MTLSTSGLRSNKKIAAALLAACFIITQAAAVTTRWPGQPGRDYLLSTCCTVTYEANREGLIRGGLRLPPAARKISCPARWRERSERLQPQSGRRRCLFRTSPRRWWSGDYATARPFRRTLRHHPGRWPSFWNFSSPNPRPFFGGYRKALGTVGYQRMALAQALGRSHQEDAGLRMDTGGIARALSRTRSGVSGSEGRLRSPDQLRRQCGSPGRKSGRTPG